MPPVTIPGPKMPPDPPEPMLKEVKMIFANGSTRMIHSGNVKMADVMLSCTQP